MTFTASARPGSSCAFGPMRPAAVMMMRIFSARHTILYTVVTKARPLIRISRGTYDVLKSLSKDMKKPMSDVAAEAIQRYSDERFWDEDDRLLETWTPEQWRQYRKEFAEWDAMPAPALP